MKKGVSVVVCCYNSVNRVGNTLKHLFNQKFQIPIHWEIIIVDNNSNDKTIEFIQNELSKYSIDLELFIVCEKQAGLSFARQRGVLESKYGYIVFCDDDNWLNPNYVETAFNVLENNSFIGALGGASTAITDPSILLPSWFLENENAFAVGRQSKETGDITHRGYLWGAGLVFRKNIFVTTYAKVPPLLTDRAGKELCSGGDSEFCARVILEGYRLFYDDTLRFKHYLESDRLSISYLKNLERSFDLAFDTLSILRLKVKLRGQTKVEKIILIIRSLITIFLSTVVKKKRKFYQYNINLLYFLTGVKFNGLKKIVYDINKL